jgi:hypothetical protein
MPIRSQVQLPKFHFSNLPNGAENAAILGEGIQVALRYSGGHWQENKWDGNGWQTLSNEDYYEPEIPVRGVVAINSTNLTAVVQFDLVGYGSVTVDRWNDNVSYQTGVINTLNAGQQYSKRITRVYLAGSSSSFTEIYLSA